MAYPVVSAPYGLVPINLIGGHPFAGSTRQIPIASGLATAIFNGDVVKLLAGGTIDKDAGTVTATPVGVFLGVSYTDATFGKVFRGSYPGGINATDIMAYVCDDPNALFKAAVVAAGGAVVTPIARAVGKNTGLVQNAGNVPLGISRVGASSTVGTAATLPLRIVDVVEETKVGANYSEIIVKWNAGMHAYENATGL